MFRKRGVSMILAALAALVFSVGGVPCRFTTCVSDVKPEDYDSHEKTMAQVRDDHKIIIEAQNLTHIDEIDNDDGDCQNCESVSKEREPYTVAVDDDSDYVIQIDGLRQKIKWTECKNPGAPCFSNAYGTEAKETSCQEKYGGVSLYVMDPTGQKFSYPMYRVPIACVCMIKARK